MTIPELKVVVKGLERNLEDAERELHVARLAASPVRVGDRVVRGSARIPVPHIITALTVSGCGEIWADITDDPLFVGYGTLAKGLTRIDEHGNPMPPRGEEAAR